MVWPSGGLNRSVPENGGLPALPWQTTPLHASAMMGVGSQYMSPEVVEEPPMGLVVEEPLLVAGGSGSLEQAQLARAVRQMRV